MKFELEKNNRNTPDEELLDDIKRVAKILNKNTVTISEYNDYGEFHSSTLQRRWKSWFKVLEKAGLNESRSKLNISNEELFENIKDIWIHLGRQPKYNEIKKPISKYSAGTYDKRFGGWMKALEQFIEYINNIDSINEQEYEDTLKLELNSNISKITHKTKREISESLRFRILMRDEFTCKSCGRSHIKSRNVELHVDHIIPWSKGGETLEENLETKCDRCNLGKGNAFNK